MKLEEVVQRGTRAAQPAATAVPAGTLYFVTDESITERSTGAAWQSYSSGSGAGDVVGPSSSVDLEFALFDGTSGKLLERATGTGFARAASGVASFAKLKRPITLVIDGGGSAITTGIKGYVSVPVACTITKNRILADQSGSIVIDVWKDTYANYPPTVADTITASAKPTLSSAIKSEDLTLTGWTTSISAGDVLGFKVDSATTVTRVTLELTVEE